MLYLQCLPFLSFLNPNFENTIVGSTSFSVTALVCSTLNVYTCNYFLKYLYEFLPWFPNAVNRKPLEQQRGCAKNERVNQLCFQFCFVVHCDMNAWMFAKRRTIFAKFFQETRLSSLGKRSLCTSHTDTGWFLQTDQNYHHYQPFFVRGHKRVACKCSKAWCGII